MENYRFYRKVGFLQPIVAVKFLIEFIIPGQDYFILRFFILSGILICVNECGGNDQLILLLSVLTSFTKGVLVI